MTIGALLGTFCAYFAYRQYYPGLSNDSCRDPFLTRLAHCKRGFDVETGMMVIDPANSHDIAMANTLHQDQYNSDDQHELEQSNSRIPLVPRS